MATELNVSDLELACYADMAEKWDEIDEVMLDYLEVLKDIMDNAIKSGEVHGAVDLLHFYAKEHYDKISGLGSSASSKTVSFLKKIEEVDLDLYKGV